MQHNIIVRAAVGLTIFLLVASLAFGWASTFREHRLAGRATTAGPAPAYSETSAATAYEARCSMCHGPANEEDWMSSRAEDREKALLEFLHEHAKAPDSENREIAEYLARMAPPKTPQSGGGLP